MTLEMIEKELRRHPLWEREIPIQMQTGIPYLYLENGALYLRYLLHRRIFRDRHCIAVVFIPAFLAKIRALKKLRQQYNMSPFCSSLAYQFLCMGNILGRI